MQASPQTVSWKVNFRQPRREYELVGTADFTIRVEKHLLARHPETARKAANRLATKRRQALAALPAAARERLAQIPFFLMEGPASQGGGRGGGLEYFQKQAPEHHPELDLRWSDAIVIYHAQNYLDISDLWAIKALVHEFAHAYQLEQWPEDQPDIKHAWENARDHGLYHRVRDVEEHKTLEVGYALSNPLEYFAELSCMFFVGCNYTPSNRGELASYDHVGYAMIRKLWKVKE